MKEKCAQVAFDMIEDDNLVGLGGGSTVSLILDKIAKSSKKVRVVTASPETKEYCHNLKIPIQELEDTESITMAFDGCDEVDQDLNALKSCGGIHTREKILASMAQEYILLADTSKFSNHLSFSFPICVEVLPSAYRLVKRQLQTFCDKVTIRKSQAKVGNAISDDGHYLLDCYFSGKQNLCQLSKDLDSMAGIVGHSLFYQQATKVILASEGTIELLERTKK